MLDLQKEVKEATVGLHGKYGSKKLDEVEKRALGQASDVQGDKEHEIVQEADKAIDLIRAEGSAVAFAKVFEQVRKDMTIVEGNLKRRTSPRSPRPSKATSSPRLRKCWTP